MNFCAATYSLFCDKMYIPVKLGFLFKFEYEVKDQTGTSQT